jgi:D-arabinose 1-dehydrogenase-like Zn-dependent alcohol dehydrogenase
MPYEPLIDEGIRVQGSLVASRRTQNEMFAFAARHSIKPTIMRFPLSVEGIEKGFEALNNGLMRYRGVLLPPK